MQSSGCKKTFSQGDFVGVTPTDTKAGQVLVDGISVLLPPLVSTIPAEVPAHGVARWQCYPLPPPIDLIVALQHFVI